MLEYDYWRERNFEDFHINFDHDDKSAHYEHKAGEGVMFCKEINDLIPAHLRNTNGAYELPELLDDEMQEVMKKIFEVKS